MRDFCYRAPDQLCYGSHSADEEARPREVRPPTQGQQSTVALALRSLPREVPRYLYLNTLTPLPGLSLLSPCSLFFRALASAYNLLLSSPCCVFSVSPTSMSASGQSPCLQASASAWQEGPVRQTFIGAIRIW